MAEAQFADEISGEDVDREAGGVAAPAVEGKPGGVDLVSELVGPSPEGVVEGIGRRACEEVVEVGRGSAAEASDVAGEAGEGDGEQVSQGEPGAKWSEEVAVEAEGGLGSQLEIGGGEGGVEVSGESEGLGLDGGGREGFERVEACV